MSSRRSIPFLGSTPLAPLALFTLFALAVAAPAAAQVNFEAQLFGQNEVPPVATEAYGSCVAVLDELALTLTVSCEHSLDPAAVTGAHVHRGFGDENGPVVFDLGDPASPIQGTWDLEEDQVVRLLAGGYYVNVHTLDHPAGEIRGRLQATAPFTDRRLAFPLRGEQVVPPLDLAADGACVAGVEIQRTPFQPVQRVEVDLRCSHDLDDPVRVVLRRGAAGEEGEVVTVLGDGVSPFQVDFLLGTPQLAGSFLDGELYVEVESAAFPDGALRGQMLGCLAGPNHLCLNGDRFQLSVTWVTETDAGDGVALQQTDDSGLFWFFRPSNLELLVKVLDGCAVNGRYWVFLAGTTDVGYDLTVTDTLTGVRRSYRNQRGDQAETVLDTDAFSTCP